MMKTALVTALSANVAMLVNGECANACNGHGRCTSYDMCVCQRNWQANDCSERVCQFGLAHVDTPKGDLNHNNVVSGPDEIVVENNFAYPYGTTEKFPRMQSSDLADLTESAHYYMECSNKGTCDRDSGECQCLPGYDGAACQRASCPGFPESCSGHGVCKTVRQLAYADNQNVYELWDRDVTMGCECDPGFSGPDCSERLCKYAVDQLYMDDTSTIKYATWDFAVVHETAGNTAADFHNGMFDRGTAYWAIRFFDMHGEDWVTKPIPAEATCAQVIDALNSLPNEVIPTMTDNLCTRLNSAGIDTDDWKAHATVTSSEPTTSEDRLIHPPIQFNTDSAKFYAGDVYRVQFYNNPGKLQQPEIETMLDGGRTSIAAGTLRAGGVQDTDLGVKTAVWTDGQQGENIDYFGDHCDGVTLTLAAGTTHSGSQVFASLTTTETQLLKACLGGSDDDDTNNVGIYDWDTGSDDYPHLLKLVLTTTSQSDGGYYVAVIFMNTKFVLLNPFDNLDVQAQNEYEVYTTQGVLARTSKFTEASVAFGSKQIITTNTTADYGIWGSSDTTGIDFGTQMGSIAAPLNGGRFTGDISCENNAADSYWVAYCVNKTDILIPLSVSADFTTVGSDNPTHINMYTVDRIGQTERTAKNFYNTAGTVKDEGTNYIDLDMSLNYWRDAGTALASPVYIYKFFPNVDSNYEYVAQCSNRGLCNNDEGLCECFAGYTGDACQIQASLAV